MLYRAKAGAARNVLSQPIFRPTLQHNSTLPITYSLSCQSILHSLHINQKHIPARKYSLKMKLAIPKNPLPYHQVGRTPFTQVHHVHLSNTCIHTMHRFILAHDIHPIPIHQHHHNLGQRIRREWIYIISNKVSPTVYLRVELCTEV